MSRAAQVIAGKTLLAECRDNPVRFCREVLGFDPHEGQERWLQGSTAAENALVTGNRWGKSFVAAAKRIHRCFYRHGWDLRRIAQMEAAHMPYRSINVAISAQQSRLVWDNAERMLRNPRASWMVKSVKQAPFPRIEFANGLAMMFGSSRIKDAERYYREAARCKAADAMEWLDIQSAKAELEG